MQPTLSYLFTQANPAQLSISTPTFGHFLNRLILSDDVEGPIKHQAEAEQEVKYKRRILKDWEAFAPLAPVKGKPWIPKNPEVVWPHMPQVTKRKAKHKSYKSLIVRKGR